ncbi:MAG: hypothetical protein GAK37_03329 [Pseudomonas sp.]|nr:MAG: hypothetical protein GAK37_03329 [Pseudomonas sp.]
MIRLLLIGCLLLLGACANHAPLPARIPALDLPLQFHVQREQNGQHLDSLLVIQREGPGIRWSMMDLLGIPQARQKLINGTWQADGLLPPNPQARELFAALLFALTSADDISTLYPGTQEMDLTRTLPEHWKITYHSSLVFRLEMLDQHLTYHISPLEAAR